MAQQSQEVRQATRDRFIAAGLTSKGQPRKPPRGYVTNAARAAAKVATSRRWQQKNPETVNAWLAANRDKRAAIEKRWRQANARRVNIWQAARSKRVRRATPPWLTREQRGEIEAWYTLGAAIGYHVDHIVPLQGEDVCGLHVPWNLRTLEPIENMRKGNRLLAEFATC